MYVVLFFCSLESFNFQILLDYEEEFKLRCSYESFLRLWPTYAKPLREHCDSKFNCEKHTPWSDDIENVLLLFKVLPPSGKGKKKLFKDIIDKVIVYQVVRSLVYC